MPDIAPVLIDGVWRPAAGAGGRGTFTASNPQTGAGLLSQYPISDWADCDAAIVAAKRAGADLRAVNPEKIADFLDAFASAIEAHADKLCLLAHTETALAIQPRLAAGELPRTTAQLRLASNAVRQGSWRRPVIDTKNNIRSQFAPVGPVCIFGPNNFPFAFNAVCGGDFAAAIAAGNPVIAKAHPLHPATSQALAELALGCLVHTGLPPATVELIYATSPADGLRLVADSRIGASAFTGSRKAGLQLKAAADAAGKPIYLEMSSINPVVILPGMLSLRRADIAREFVASVLLGSGQFCTNPGLVLLLKNADSDAFIADVSAALSAAPVGTLFSAAVRDELAAAIKQFIGAGAALMAGGRIMPGPRFACENTVLAISGSQFLRHPDIFQREAFGNACLMVQAHDVAELVVICGLLEGNLTGTIYADDANDASLYDQIAELLRPRVGRLLNNKMPTGVAVSPAMNHGGPFPASGHAHFTAVGIPAAIERFTRLECFDNVPQHRLPPALRDAAPPGYWQCVDGQWRQSPPAADSV